MLLQTLNYFIFHLLFFNSSSCGKAFSNEELLKIHDAVFHDRQNKYKCEQCGKTFGFKSYLKKHVDIIHKKLRNEVCNECGKTFGERQTLKHHIQSVHKGIKPHKCDLCQKFFTTKQILRNHINNVHEGTYFIETGYTEINQANDWLFITLAQTHMAPKIKNFHDPF